MTTLTVGSLFSGIGGLDLGLQWAGGFETVWFCELDPFCQKVLRKHWPEVPIHDDVRTLGAANAIRPDVLIGGFPCQPHSLAGQRRGSADERDLWGEFARLIGEFKPRWIVAENVPGLLNSEGGRFFGRVLRDLAACGYDAEWESLPAFAFGAPHRRDRVFIVAHPHCQRPQAGIFGQLLPQPPNPARWNAQSARSGGNAITRWEWTAESVFCGVDNGATRRVHRIRALGNAVVPQVAEYIGRCIMAAEQAQQEQAA